MTTPLPIHFSFTQSLNQLSGTSGSSNALTLRLPQTARSSHCHVSLRDISLVNSWPNVSSQYGNRMFSYIWSDSSVNTVTLPDNSDQSIASINLYLMQAMIANGHYLVSTSGGPSMYFMVLASNLSAYRTQLTITPVPSSAPAGYAQPSNATWSYPTTPTCPYLIIPPATTPSSFSSLIGFNPGQYPPTASSTVYNALGQMAPQNPVTAVFVHLDRAQNPITPGPTNVLYAFPITSSYGSAQREMPAKPQWVRFMDSQYSTLTLSLHDQLNRPIPLQDTSTLFASIEIEDSDVCRGIRG